MNAAISVTGWVLLHFVWQGTAIAALAALILRSARGAPAQLRYSIACMGLAGMLTMPLGTAFAVARTETSVQFPSRTSQVESRHSTFAGGGSSWGGAIEPARVLVPRKEEIERVFPLLVVIWLAGATALLLERWLGWRRVRAVHDAALRLPTSPWQASAQRLAERLGVSSVFRVVELVRVDVPIVVGWLRPVVILPVAMCAHVPPRQIEALLAHEMAHIARRDYLVNLVQIAAEAIFFYHPGVWWISARIRLERELCCDDLAIHACRDRLTYARALAAVEESRMARVQFGLAATDGPLLKRIRRILRPIERRECPRHGMSVIAAAMLAVGVIGGVQAIATAQRAPSPAQDQTTASIADGPAFEVASVKANRSGEIGARLRPAPDGSLTAWNEPLPSLLEFAYGYPTYRIEGLPDWALTERFDITAKSASTQPTSVDRVALMLRSLLADRFMLKSRTEVRQVPVYELQLDRTDRRLGPRLMETTRDDCRVASNNPLGPTAQRGRTDSPPCGIGNGFGFIRARGVPASELAEALGRFVDRPVIDRTGLRGLFDADVSFTPDQSPFPVPVPLDVPADASATAIFTAVREQLGLKLAAARGEVEVIVVTSIERPTAD